MLLLQTETLHPLPTMVVAPDWRVMALDEYRRAEQHDNAALRADLIARVGAPPTRFLLSVPRARPAPPSTACASSCAPAGSLLCAPVKSAAWVSVPARPSAARPTSAMRSKPGCHAARPAAPTLTRTGRSAGSVVDSAGFARQARRDGPPGRLFVPACLRGSRGDVSEHQHLVEPNLSHPLSPSPRPGERDTGGEEAVAEHYAIP
jgi:hypothetical protein